MVEMKKINENDDLRKIKSLYYHSFPKNERWIFNDLVNNSVPGCEVFSFYDNDIFIGMAATLSSNDITHILYFAIEESLRGRGYGSIALGLINKYYFSKRIMADIELPIENAKNYDERIKRKSFYLRLGYKETDVKYKWRNESYEILSYGGNVTIADYESFWKQFE